MEDQPPCCEDPPQTREEKSPSSHAASVADIQGDVTGAEEEVGVPRGNAAIAWVDTVVPKSPVWVNKMVDPLPEWPEEMKIPVEKSEKCDEENMNKKLNALLTWSKKQRSEESRERMCRWGNTDTVLALTFLAAILITCACAYSVLPRWQPLPNK